MTFSRIFLATVCAGYALTGIASAQDATGAGASFPAPLYMQWADSYAKATGTKINYQSVGSSAGVKQIIAKTVDFAASDAPLTDDDLKTNGFIQFPTVIGGVTPVINLKGVNAGQLKLTGSVLADIFLGKIANWNDKAIADLNSGVTLPNEPITVVLRADGSGTTNVFTDYLSKVSAEWKGKVGSGNAVEWPSAIANRSTSGKGNAGVAAVVAANAGTIGYVEYAYAKQNNIPHVVMENADGKYVQPGEAAFKAAAAGINWNESFAQSLNNAKGADVWPITTATFILMDTKPQSPERVAKVLQFLDWAYTSGDQSALDLDYVPFPDSVKSVIRASWAEIKDANGKPISYK